MSVINSYIKNESWRVKENASTGYSLGAMNGHISSRETAHHWLNNVYTPEIAEMHKSAKFHIHDLGQYSAYCNGWSLRQLITEGFGGVPNQISSAPAEHLNAIVNQMYNFMGVMSNESAGAQAFSSVDTYLAPFVKVDNLSYKEVKQCMQNLVFGLNIPSRWSGMAPFTNFTFDIKAPDDMKDTACIVGGVPQDFTYGECQKEMDMINTAFMEVMVSGDCNGRGFAYPIPTYNVTKDFDWDGKVESKVFEMSAKYGIPYFQNFITSDLNPSDVRSMCCRLQLSLSELRKKSGGLFGAEEFTGSIGVVTINMPNIALCEKAVEGFKSELIKRMSIAKDSLEIKRKVVQSGLDADPTLYPYTKRYLYMGYKNHFSTIGLCGMNEACETLFGKDLTDPECVEFAADILNLMREHVLKFQEETGNLYNLESSPAESVSYRFAKHDIKEFGSKIPHGGSVEECYYTNSSNLPVGATNNMFEALNIQEVLQKIYTGGTVFHGYIGEEITTEQCKKVVRSVFEKYGIPYLSITPTYSVCKEHGYIRGEYYNCPACGSETEVYSRITGYYRPIKNWNKGKSGEFKGRKLYEVR